MHLHIRHTTRYRFDAPVRYGLQQLRKTPKTGPQQQVREWETRIAGGRKELTFTDHHRNITELIGFDPDTTELSITCEGRVEMTDTNGLAGPHRGPAPLWLYLQQTRATRARSGVKALLRSIKPDAQLESLHALSAVIRASVEYRTGVSRPDWSAEDAIEAGAGVCQDHTHIFLAGARALQIPARYVSGYLMLNDTTVQDAMHAWAEAHVDGLGWVGFDISNGISPDARYVRVATGLDYSDAAPISGSRIGGAGEALRVEITVAQQ
ncbi:transglutaminase family protein [Thalassococcus sp. CAU 1522]|uniref:Transglutaminase family protein n=1 Tax=Thalassococcus arenae TaxID=2851652 RepID=A0ABS6N4R0_9RHOB|nr:transglutaminase family protein [Thalassococcus arenae]MBV2358599.1 transglutaminase family protein [Thalassococcus arenae]